MALTSLHETMTRDVMEEEGFDETARKIAADADAYVDNAPGQQGSQAKYTNLHAMCGYIRTSTGDRLQTRQECQDAVAGLLVSLRSQAAEAVLAGDRNEGLRLLGTALHTVQDLSFHHYEPWPFDGIGNACVRDPIYMLGHGIRDVGLFSLDLQRVTQGHVELEVTRRIRLWDVYLTLDGAHHPATPYPLNTPVGADPAPIEPLGWSAMIKITFGAAPHSLPPPSHSVEEQMRRRSEPIPTVQPFTQALLYGPADRASAEDATKEYLKQLRRAIEESSKAKAGAWASFLSGPPSKQPSRGE